MVAPVRKAFLGWLCVLLFCVASIAFELMGVRAAEQAQSWPSADGRILSSALQPGCGKDQRQLMPRVVYEYRARGLPYQGDRVAMDTDFCGWSRGGMEIVQAYRPGQAVTVYYDPSRPSRAVLRQGPPQQRTSWTLIGFTALAALAVARMSDGVRRTKRQRRSHR